jgi:replicative DNA helicase
MLDGIGYAEMDDKDREETDVLLANIEREIEESRARRGAATATTKAGQTICSMSDALKAWLMAFEAEQKDPDVGRISITGIPDLDAKTKMRAGEITVIAARPGMGKSALAGNIAAANAKRGVNVAVFSLEMSREQLTTRMVSSEGRVNMQGNLGAVQWDKIVRACESLSKFHVWIDDRSAISASQMRKALLTIPAPKLIVVDYLGLMPDGKSAQRHDIAVGDNVKEIRALAKDFGAHAILLCQLSRKVEERKPPRPQLSDLRDSGNIEEHADNVWMIYREGYYDHEIPDTTAEIQIEKQRQGARGIAKVAWRGEYQTFSGLAHEPHDWKQAAAGDK